LVLLTRHATKTNTSALCQLHGACIVLLVPPPTVPPPTADFCLGEGMVVADGPGRWRYRPAREGLHEGSATACHATAHEAKGRMSKGREPHMKRGGVTRQCGVTYGVEGNKGHCFEPHLVACPLCMWRVIEGGLLHLQGNN
jgi:hypothetical protein